MAACARGVRTIVGGFSARKWQTLIPAWCKVLLTSPRGSAEKLRSRLAHGRRRVARVAALVSKIEGPIGLGSATV